MPAAFISSAGCYEERLARRAQHPPAPERYQQRGADQRERYEDPALAEPQRRPRTRHGRVECTLDHTVPRPVQHDHRPDAAGLRPEAGKDEREGRRAHHKHGQGHDHRLLPAGDVKPGDNQRHVPQTPDHPADQHRARDSALDQPGEHVAAPADLLPVGSRMLHMPLTSGD